MSFRPRSAQNHASTGRSFLIVTEDSESSVRYFTALRDTLKIPRGLCHIVHPKSTDPVGLTNAAVKLRNERKQASKASALVPFDETWVVFDLEGTHSARHQQNKDARRIAEENGILLCESNPCFEVWIMLHHEYSTGSHDSCNSVIASLKRYTTKYEKATFQYGDHIKRTSVAVTNAEQCRNHHATTNGDGNPGTEVDKLVRALNSSVPLHRQMPLGRLVHGSSSTRQHQHPKGDHTSAGQPARARHR